MVLEWLCQELDRSRLHRADRHGHVAVTREEDDGHVAPLRRDALLQLETIEVRKAHVEDQAARSNGSRVVQELVRGRKGRRLPARGVDQQFQRLAYRYVVVHDEYGWCGVQHDALSWDSASGRYDIFMLQTAAYRSDTIPA